MLPHFFVEAEEGRAATDARGEEQLLVRRDDPKEGGWPNGRWVKCNRCVRWRRALP